MMRWKKIHLFMHHDMLLYKCIHYSGEKIHLVMRWNMLLILLHRLV